MTFWWHLIYLLTRYEMIRVTDYRLEPSEKGRGLFNYLWDQVNIS